MSTFKNSWPGFERFGHRIHRRTVVRLLPRCGYEKVHVAIDDAPPGLRRVLA